MKEIVLDRTSWSIISSLGITTVPFVNRLWRQSLVYTQTFAKAFYRRATHSWSAREKSYHTVAPPGPSTWLVFFSVLCDLFNAVPIWHQRMCSRRISHVFLLSSLHFSHMLWRGSIIDKLQGFYFGRLVQIPGLKGVILDCLLNFF